MNKISAGSLVVFTMHLQQNPVYGVVLKFYAQNEQYLYVLVFENDIFIQNPVSAHIDNIKLV